MNPLVSVIVTTRNNHDTLDTCLSSIINQTYQPIELIVVDHDSLDGTKVIAKYYTSLVFNCGPDCTSKRNFGVSKASGQYVMIIDSDMVLSPHIVQDCLDTMQYKPGTVGIVIPEEPIAKNFWFKFKDIAHWFSRGEDTTANARFFAKDIYEQVHNPQQTMSGSEDPSTRLRNLGRIESILATIRRNHNYVLRFKEQA